MSVNIKIAILCSVSALAIISVLCTPAIPQDLGYHNFFDQRSFFGIANFWNVISNLPFLIVGLLGLHLVWQQRRTSYIAGNCIAYSIFALGICLVALGSSYYHLNPDNNTLLWDRLPMTLAFMSFFSIVIADYISPRFASRALLPLLILGAASVIYWHYTESRAVGDLRFYALVQFLPVILISLILFMFNRPGLHTKLIWLVLGMYVLAKLFEAFDYPIYEFLGVISGHSIKHVAAALGAYVLIIRARKLAQIS